MKVRPGVQSLFTCSEFCFMINETHESIHQLIVRIEYDVVPIPVSPWRKLIHVEMADTHSELTCARQNRTETTFHCHVSCLLLRVEELFLSLFHSRTNGGRPLSIRSFRMSKVPWAVPRGNQHLNDKECRQDGRRISPCLPCRTHATDGAHGIYCSKWSLEVTIHWFILLVVWQWICVFVRNLNERGTLTQRCISAPKRLWVWTFLLVWN